MEQQPGVLAQLARLVSDNAAEAPLALRLCRASARLLDADGAAITLAYTEPERLTVCFTDATADRIADLQDVLGEGPGPDAYRTGQSVTGELGGDQSERWPMFAEAARQAVGPVTVHAIPMRPRREVVGVMTIYQTEVRPLARSTAEVQFLANAVGAAIVGDDGMELSEQTWASRDRINQATGMVVAQLSIAPDDALAILRAHAFSSGITLSEAADEVLSRRQDFSDADDEGTAG